MRNRLPMSAIGSDSANTVAGNNYLVTGTTSAGGTLMEQEAQMTGPIWPSLTLEGGPITGSSEAYGSLTFDAKVNSGTTLVDPLVLIGFLDCKTILRLGRAGLGGFNFADSSLTAFHLQRATDRVHNPLCPREAMSFAWNTTRLGPPMARFGRPFTRAGRSHRQPPVRHRIGRPRGHYVECVRDFSPRYLTGIPPSSSRSRSIT